MPTFKNIINNTKTSKHVDNMPNRYAMCMF